MFVVYTGVRLSSAIACEPALCRLLISDVLLCVTSSAA